MNYYELKECPADFIAPYVVINLYNGSFEFFDIKAEAEAFVAWANK